MGQKNKKRALITGIAGFAGSFLVERLLEAGNEIVGILAPGEATGNIKHLLTRIEIHELSITDLEPLRSAILASKPDFIYHLAALASVGQSFQMERQSLEVNLLGSLNVLESARSSPSLKKILVVGSGDSYGIFKPKGKLLKESDLFNPISPYAISKAAMEFLARYYFRQYRLPVVIARCFNHSGPRQSEHFAIPSFCRQIARIERGLMPPVMQVGDLSARRDFSDVRDIVNAYYLLTNKGEEGEVYHLSSGKAVSIRQILNLLLAQSDIRIEIRVDKNRLRKSDIPVLRGDNRKAVRKLGWKPRFELDRTLKDTLNYWREKEAQAN